MQFDTLIIGGGLAGLLCGIRLSASGQRCAIVSRGQSTLNFASGSLDLLSRLPDGQPVTTLPHAIAQLPPAHPYALLGEPLVRRYARQVLQIFAECGLTLQGDIDRPHLRVTPLGILRRAWLSPLEVALKPQGNPRIGVVGIGDFLDFQPQLAAAGLRQHGIDAHAEEIALPSLDRLRENPSEFRAVNIARLLDDPAQFDELFAALWPLSQRYDLLYLPACFGLEDNDLFARLNQQLVAAPLRLLPTLPPSLPGIRMQQKLQQHFIRCGGYWMPGDEVTHAEVVSGRVTQLWTRKHEDIPLRADNVVLASGSFFSNGLIAGRDGVREPIFGLDILQSETRSDWYNDDFFASQPWQRFGVQTNASLNGLRRGEAIRNLYVIGAVSGGFDAIAEGCAGGVSVVTALHAARIITQEARHE